MVVDLGPERFASARRSDRIAAAAQAAAERDAALAALIETRAEFSALADETYERGARLAARDSDLLESIAGRLLGVVDGLEPCFDRLDIAREIAVSDESRTPRMLRSGWDRTALALAFCEAVEPLLSPAAHNVLSAAVRLEARR